MAALPFSSRISSIQRFLPIESRVAPGHNAVVEIQDVSIAVGIDHVIEMLLEVFHRFQKFREVLRFEHLERLARIKDLAELADIYRNLLMGIEAGRYGAVVRLAKGHLAFTEAARSFYFDSVLPFAGHSVAVTILVFKRVPGVIKGLHPGVAGVGLVHSHSPA